MNESDLIEDEEDEVIEEQIPISVDQLSLDMKEEESNNPFQLTISKEKNDKSMETIVIQNNPESLVATNVFLPHPRRSSFLQFHKGILYLYGGKFEDKDDKELTLNDLYSLNVKKLDEWNLLYEDPEFKIELEKKTLDSGIKNIFKIINCLNLKTNISKNRRRRKKRRCK
jgi:hypothetical protein